MVVDHIVRTLLKLALPPSGQNQPTVHHQQLATTAQSSIASGKEPVSFNLTWPAMRERERDYVHSASLAYEDGIVFMSEPSAARQ